MSIPSSVADTALGLTTSELQLLRQQQQLAQQRHQAETASRGRANSRASQPSSRAASAASSQGQGRVFLDPGNLQRLTAQFENLMRRIQDRMDVLQDATQRSVEASYDRAGNMIQGADAELVRMRRILAELDSLEAECEKIKRIRDVVKRLRNRIDDADARLDRSYGHGHGARDPRRRP